MFRCIEVLLSATDLKLLSDCDDSPWYFCMYARKNKLRLRIAQTLLAADLNPNYEHDKFKQPPNPPRFPKILRFLPTASMIFYKCLRPITEVSYLELSADPCALASELIMHGAVVNQVSQCNVMNECIDVQSCMFRCFR